MLSTAVPSARASSAVARIQRYAFIKHSQLNWPRFAKTDAGGSDVSDFQLPKFFAPLCRIMAS